MVRPRAWLPAVMAVTVACAACSALVELASFTGGAMPLDGGGGADSSLDALGADSGGDGGAPDAPFVPFCTRNADAAFCDDFDNGELGATWSDKALDGLATLSKDSRYTRSPPSSFLTSIPSRNGTVSDYYEIDIARAAQRAVWSFDVRIDTSSLDALRLATVRRASLGIKVRVVLTNTTPPRWSLTEVQEREADAGGDITKAAPSTVPFTTGAWHAVSVSVDISGRRATLTVDGAPIVSMDLSTTWQAGPVEGYLGVAGLASPRSLWEVRFDNALLVVE